MKYITQMLYILLFSLLGEFLQKVIPLPIPAAIYGLVLLLLALCTGILKEEKVAEISGFLILVMPILFVAPVARLLQYWGIIGPNVVAICVVMAVSSVIVFGVAGLIAKLCLRNKKEDEND